MNDLFMPPSPDAPRRYASPLIAERRSRILTEARHLIGEVGMQGFTLRDLGRRAGVSVTTIYNNFGDKEGVIAHALREFHSGIRLQLPSSGSNLAGFCRVIADTTSIVIANRAYAITLSELYFSSSLPETLFDVIRGMPLQPFSHWLWLAAREGLLSGAMHDEDAEAMFANLEWASVKDWGAGRVRTADLPMVRQRSFLTVAAAICDDSTANAATALLRQLACGTPAARPGAISPESGSAPRPAP